MPRHRASAASHDRSCDHGCIVDAAAPHPRHRSRPAGHRLRRPRSGRHGPQSARPASFAAAARRNRHGAAAPVLYNGIVEVIEQFQPDGDGRRAALRPLRPPAHGDPDGPRPRRHLAGGGAARACRSSATTPRGSRRRSPATAGRPRSRCSATIQRELGLAKLPEPPDVADALAAALCHYYAAEAAGAEESRMITKITGVLNRVLDEEVRLQVGPLEYQVLVPEFVRRQVQMQRRPGGDAAHQRLPRRQPDAGPGGAAADRLPDRGGAGVLRAVLHRGQGRRPQGAQGAGPAGQGDRRRHPAAGRQVADDAARHRRRDGRADRRHAAAQGDASSP